MDGANCRCVLQYRNNKGGIMFESRIQKAVGRSLCESLMGKLGFGPDVWAGVMTVKQDAILCGLDGSGQAFEEAMWCTVEETLDFPGCIVESDVFERKQVRINGSDIACSTDFECPDGFEGKVVAYAVGYFNGRYAEEPVFVNPIQRKTILAGFVLAVDHKFGQPQRTARTIDVGDSITFNAGFIKLS